MEPNRVITLTTDFGTSDYFVGAMKGVIASIAPYARVIDITHDVAPYNTLEAAFTLSEAAPYFPDGSIHVIVVDPGVGSERRALLAEAHDQFFIAPDNGVLTLALEKEGRRGDGEPPRVRAITNPKLALKDVSRTFHGRDVFAPAAAHLSLGVEPAEFGKQIDDYIRIEGIVPARLSPNSWRGAILKIDRFGNLITTFHIDEFSAIKTNPFTMRLGLSRDPFAAEFSGEAFSRDTAATEIRRLALTFSDTEPGELAVVVGSSGYLEIIANRSSAAQKLGYTAGAPVDLEIDVR